MVEKNVRQLEQALKLIAGFPTKEPDEFQAANMRIIAENALKMLNDPNEK